MPDFSLSPEIKELRAKAKAFMDEHIYPNESVFHEGSPEQAIAVMKDLQARTKAMGMWAMFIGPDLSGRLTSTGRLTGPIDRPRFERPWELPGRTSSSWGTG